MASEPDALVRARRFAIAGGILLAAVFAFMGVGSLVVYFTPVRQLNTDSWIAIRNAMLIVTFAPVIPSFVASLISVNIRYKHNRGVEAEEAAVRAAMTTQGNPAVESFPTDPRPDTRKYIRAQTGLLFGFLMTPYVAGILLLAIATLTGTGDSAAPILWATLAIAAVITIGSLVAMPIVARAKANANARWEIAQREAREAAALDPR